MNLRTIARIISLALVFSLTPFAAWPEDVTNAPEVSAKPVFPGTEWEHQPNRIPPATVRAVDAYLKTLDTTGLMVVQHSRVIYEYGDVKRLSYLASARKSVLSMIYGANMASGKIHLEATVKDLGMSDLGGLLPIEEQTKVIDLLTARSGVYHLAANGGDDLDSAPKRGSKKPGDYWLYSNWDFNAAGAAFERMTGKNIYDALRDDLAKSIGMQDFDRRRQQKSGNLTRSTNAAYHMVLSTRDMARLGLLMLRQGRWRDRQIIHADWVRRSTSARSPVAEVSPGQSAEPFGYGYLWWVWDGPSVTGPYKGAYTANGAYGQYITVLPELDLVVVHKTWPTGMVLMTEYLRLLDLLTGKQPATTAELDRWENVPARYGSYLGQYRITPNTTLGTNPIPSLAGIRREGNRLLVDIELPARTGPIELRLSPTPETNSFTAPGGRPYTFFPDAKGKISRLTARIFGSDVSFDRFSDQPMPALACEESHVAIKLDPHIYDAYAGHYSRAPYDGRPDVRAITIKRDGDALIGQMFTGRNPRRFAEEYFPESETHFFNTTEDEELTFVKNNLGEVTSVIVEENGTFGDFDRQVYTRGKSDGFSDYVIRGVYLPFQVKIKKRDRI